MKSYMVGILVILMLGVLGCASEVVDKGAVSNTAEKVAMENEQEIADTEVETEETTKGTTDTAQDNMEAKDSEPEKTGAVEDSSSGEPTTKEINMVAKKWSFEPETITVKQGDTVLLHVESIDVKHGISLPAFGVNENLNAGETVDIEFVADKKGSFPFICSVWCGVGHGGMKGTIIVE
jgi:cytochrome c oxidase subunit II